MRRRTLHQSVEEGVSKSGACDGRGYLGEDDHVGKAEEKKPIGIKYVVQDVREEAEAKDEERFDLATAAWLLVYCKSVNELKEMWQSGCELREAWRKVLTIITNPQIALIRKGRRNR